MSINFQSLLLDICKKVSNYLKINIGNSKMLEIVSRSKSDVTRRIDLEVEKLIIEKFNEERVESIIYCEEEGIIKLSNNPKYIIVIDPLDGSLNYTLNIPWYAISIAIGKYSKINYMKNLEIGIVYNVPQDLYYYSELPNKFESNDNTIFDSNIKIDKPLVISYIEPIPESNYVNKILKIFQLLSKCKVRTLGAASLEILSVCTGKATLFLDLRSRLRIVDIAGSYVISKTLNTYLVNEYGRSFDDYVISNNLTTCVIACKDKDLLNKVLNVLKVE